MRILWINFGLLPIACRAMGYKEECGCGWIPSLLDSIKDVDTNNQFCVLSLDWRRCDIQLENVRYVSMNVRHIRFTYKSVPEDLRRRIKSIISQFNPDVIHVHGTEYFFGCLPRDTYCGAPVVVSVQGVISGCATQMNGGLHPSEVRKSNFCLRGILKGQTIFGDQLTWMIKRREQEVRVLTQQKNFIGRTEWDRAWVEFYNPGANYYHVNESLRPAFALAKRNAGSIRRHTIYCGAAASSPLKGVHWLLRAISSLKDEFPDIQLRIAACADYMSERRPLVKRLKDQAYHVYLRELVKKLDVVQQVVALPVLTSDEVANELCRADLFVLPSLCENSPNALCEAMMVGTPSVATYVGGIPSILKNEVEGKLVPSGDPAALASAIKHWFLHPEEASICAKRGMNTARKRHDQFANAKATLAVYRSVINGK